jgi:hypothetical protein
VIASPRALRLFHCRGRPFFFKKHSCFSMNASMGEIESVPLDIDKARLAARRRSTVLAHWFRPDGDGSAGQVSDLC